MCIKAAVLSRHPFHLDLSLQNTMKVVLGILVLLHCAAQVQTLSCLSCAAGTADEATCTTKGCPADQAFCFSTYTVTGSTTTVEKGCKAACVETENPRTSCCSVNNCNVVQLRCYTCPTTNDESTCTVNVCGLAHTLCKNTYDKSGTGPTATYSVTKTCATKETCTEKLDAFPRVSCCTAASCNGDKLTCFQCAETTDESSCAPSPCAAGAFCKSDYKLNGAGVPVVIKSCTADCKAVNSTTDKNVRTTCCKTGYCNENALSCNTCTNEANESKCAATACAATDKLCQSTYTLTAPDVLVSKACAGACTPSTTVKCCGTSQCNVELLKCYTCTDLTDETKCKDITVCGFGDKFCKTTYKLNGTDVTVSKGCASTCTVTTAFPRDECCQGKLCNAPLIKSCQTCDNEKVENNCAEKDCATPSSFCQRKIDFTKDGFPVTKGCAAQCTASDTASCCQVSNCRVNTLSCLQCDAQTNETQCKAGVCTVGTFCQNRYNFTNLASIKVTKTCESACTESNTVNCCQTSNCNVKALFCYTCDKQSDETLCTTVKACRSALGKCSSVYETGVDGKITVTKGCEASPGACVPGTVGNKRTTCCNTELCNVPKLSCLTCDAVTDENTPCQSKACDGTNKFCDSVYDISKKPITATKKCVASCSSKTATTEVKCCSTSDCNVPILKCYTCNKTKSETDCTTLTACDFSVGSCFAYYDTTPTGTTVTKGCDRTCASLDDLSRRRTCCTTDLCNEPKLSCYTCNGLADEKQCTTVTACSAESKFCKTVRITIAGKTTAVTKTCEATCTASSTAFQTVECCQASQCNKYQERGTGASPSTQASSLLLAVSISLLTMLLKSA